MRRSQPFGNATLKIQKSVTFEASNGVQAMLHLHTSHWWMGSRTRNLWWLRTCWGEKSYLESHGYLSVYHRQRWTRNAPVHSVATATMRGSNVYNVPPIEPQPQDVTCEDWRSDCGYKDCSPPSWKWHARNAGTLISVMD